MARHNQSTNRRRTREQASKRHRDHIPAALSGLDLMARYNHVADRDREVWR